MKSLLITMLTLHLQLDDACRRGEGQSGIGGSLLLLSVWKWERFSVGRPTPGHWLPWDNGGDEDRLPTWAYKWDVIPPFYGDGEKEYERYTNEFDALTPEQVMDVFFLLTLLLSILHHVK